MVTDFAEVRELYARHPAWRLLRLQHAPLILSFLHRVYIDPNRRLLSAVEFTRLLDDELFAIRQRESASLFPKCAADYLADWVNEGVLRRSWAGRGDAEQIDLTPQTEKAIQWVVTLRERAFVGTESRLLTFVELVRQMVEESDPDVPKRLAVLERQRADLDAKIERVRQGEIDVLSDSELRDRFQQMDGLARGLLADFREVEDNFRKLSREARERMALWDGSKGHLLDEVWQSRDTIRESDQGRSFEAFCGFLLSAANRDELSASLATALRLPAVQEQARHARLDHVHNDWIAAGEATQQTIALLSQQLRRFLDDQALRESRRIMEILRGVESHAIALRNHPPTGFIASMDGMRCEVELPMEKQIYRPAVQLLIVHADLETGEGGGEDALYCQYVVDRGALAAHIEVALAEHTSLTLRELTDMRPISRGLAEVVTYLDLGSSRFHLQVLDFMQDSVRWAGAEEESDMVEREATMRRVLFEERAA